MIESKKAFINLESRIEENSAEEDGKKSGLEKWSQKYTIRSLCHKKGSLIFFYGIGYIAVEATPRS